MVKKFAGASNKLDMDMVSMKIILSRVGLTLLHILYCKNILKRELGDRIVNPTTLFKTFHGDRCKWVS